MSAATMDEEQRLAFFLEWYDPQSGQQKGYILYYHGDNTVELVERHTKKVFLKRIHVPTVKLDDLFVGSSISVYSRQLTIVAAANEYTRRAIQWKASKVLFVITPSGYPHMGRIVQLIEQAGLLLRTLRMATLQQAHLAKLQTLGALPDDNNQQHLLRDVSVLAEVSQPEPKMLSDVRTKLQAAGLAEVVLVAEIGLGELASRPGIEESFPTTAVLDNCSLCLIRPRLLRENRVGEVLDAILAAGFEISALKFVHLEMHEANELLQIYKGVVRQYHEVLKYMCSSPCVALEIRGHDVVRRFRELCGPFDVQIAQTLRPTSLRAKFGRSNLHNALHCTDCPEDGVLESRFIFRALGSQ